MSHDSLFLTEPEPSGGSARLMRHGSRPIRWMLMAAAVVAACITGFVVLNTQQMTVAQQQSWRLTMQAQLDGVVEQANRWLQEREEGAKAAATFEPVMVLYSRLRAVTQWEERGNVVQWRADLKSLLAPNLNRNGIVGYVMTTRGGQVLADSGSLAGQVLDSEMEQALLQKTLTGPRYSQVSLPMAWQRSPAFQLERPVILASAAIWPRGPDLEPGVLILVIDPRTHFDDIFKRARTGMSGETYGVSPDGRFVTPTRFESDVRHMGARVAESVDPANSLQAAAPLTRAAQELAQGRAGENLEGYRDYRGVKVIGLWRWEPQHGLGVITEVDLDEAYASIHSMRRQSALTVVSTLLLISSLGAAFAWWSRRMTTAKEQLRVEHLRANDLAAASAAAEREVRERETHLRMLLDAFPGYMAIMDKRNHYVYVNRQLADILGREPEDVIGRHFSEVVDPESAAELEVIFALPPGNHHKSDFRTVSHQGRRVRHLERHRIVGPEHANGAGVNFAFGFDITHARRGQELEAFRSQAMEMITSGELLKNILLQLVGNVESMLLTSMCSVQLLDEEGSRFTQSISRSMPAIFDQTLQGLTVGPDMGSFGAAADTGQRCVVKDSRQDPTWGGLAGLATRAGVGSSWSVPITSPGHQVLGTLTVCHAQAVEPDNLDFYIMDQMAQLASVAIERDRTADRLQAQDSALREQQMRLQLAIDNMLDGFVRAHMDDSLVMVNKALVSILGYESTSELLGRPSKELYARLEDWQYLVNTLKTGSELRNFRCQARRKDGELIWVEVSSHATAESDGQHSGIEAVVRDVTQQIEFEEALKDARNAAQAAADARGAFLANMSHEIRTPMNAIIGLTELALRTELTPRQQDYLDKVSQAAHNLLGILNDILDFSKIESGRLDLEEIVFNLDEVLDQTASVLGMQVEEKGLQLQVVRPPEVPVGLVGDPLRLGQILLNLANNAKKFTEQGSVVISVRLLEQSERSAALHFSVQDTGIGMTPQQISRLFQPFSQADQSTTRRFGGTGLGLAISRQLVEMMGGRIWVDSEPGAGSDFQFEIELRLAPAQPQAASGAAAQGRPAKDRRSGARRAASDPRALARIRGARVLLVEDNAINQQVATELLQQAGLVVELACHGQEALDKLAQASYDVVLMDLQMPVMDGYTAATRIRANPAWRDLPVLAMTANAMAEDRARVQEVGMNDHIAKPVVPDALFQALLRWVPAMRPEGAGADAPPSDAAPSGLPPPDLASGAAPQSEELLPQVLVGLEVNKALANVGGNPKLLRKLLADLAQDHADDVQRMQDALQAGDDVSARRFAHTLKGVGGTLAAPALQQAAAALEQALHRGAKDQVGPCMAQLRTVLEPLLASLLAWAVEEGLLDGTGSAIRPIDPSRGEGEPSAGSAAPDPEEVQAVVLHLDNQLAAFDPEAAETAERLAALLGPRVPQAAQLVALTAGFDFDAARAVLSDLRAQLQAQGNQAVAQAQPA